MVIDEIVKELFLHQDGKYREMQIKITPGRKEEDFIGVRTPELRSYAKQLGKREDVEEFLTALPHTYFEEDQLHAFIISEMKDYECCMEHLNAFLPYVDNWATCDQMSPKIFRKYRKELLGQIRKWLKSKETYTIRFAVGMLMEHFLDEDFDLKYPEMVAGIRSEEY